MSEAGKVFMFGFTEEVISKERLKFFKSSGVNSFILFRKNIARIKENIKILKNEFEDPLIAVDQEGGIVRRFPQTDAFFFGNMNAAMSGSANYIKDLYRKVGDVLRENGVNVDLAPVIDVYLKKGNSIGIRSFGSDPLSVARFSDAAISGLHEAGVLSAVKHFIGYGAAAKDPHKGLPVFEGSNGALEKAVLPFKHTAKNADFVMSAHIIVPFLDEKLPVTFSKNALQFLRKAVSFNGPIITDCLEMGGAMIFPKEEIALKALSAGNDLLIVSHTLELQKAMFQSVEKSSLNKSGVDLSEKIARIEKAKEKIRKAESAEKEVTEKFVSVFKNSGFIPLKEGEFRFLFPQIVQEVQVEETEAQQGDYPLDVKGADIQRIAAFPQKSAVFVSYNAFRHRGQVALAKQMKENGKRVCVIVAGDPADIPLFNFADCIVLTLSPLKEVIRFALRVIQGKAEAKGRLPVSKEILWTE